MNTFVLFSLINLSINALVWIISSKLFKNFEDLGNRKVHFALYSVKNHKALKISYRMQIAFNDKIITQVITKDQYKELSGYNETYVNIRKFKKAYLNPDLVEYEFSIDYVDWNDRDKKRCIKGFIYVVSVVEILGIIISGKL